MALKDLMAQLQSNAAAAEARRKSASESMLQAAAQKRIQSLNSSPVGRPGRPGKPGPTADNFNPGDWPTVGDQHRHDSGYDWAKWSGDINVPGAGDMNNPVSAWKRGTVIAANKWKDSYGKHVRIKHPDGTETLYAHLAGMRVKPGQTVRAGQQIGRVGSTGNSSGPHLHFEII